MAALLLLVGADADYASNAVIATLIDRRVACNANTRGRAAEQPFVAAA
jgi:hypothetical protein